MSHSSGFEAWMRNQKGLGKTGFYTAEDLLRSKRGGIEATDADSTPLPPLSTTACAIVPAYPNELTPPMCMARGAFLVTCIGRPQAA